MNVSKKSQMVAGFNHNINHNGKIYHVQTEDSGTDNPHIITHLFVGGNILATKKTSYSDIVNAENLQDVVQELMQEQHKAMLRNLINGVYDGLDFQALGHSSEPPLPVAPVAAAAPMAAAPAGPSWRAVAAPGSEAAFWSAPPGIRAEAAPRVPVAAPASAAAPPSSPGPGKFPLPTGSSVSAPPVAASRTPVPAAGAVTQPSTKEAVSVRPEAPAVAAPAHPAVGAPARAASAASAPPVRPAATSQPAASGVGGPFRPPSSTRIHTPPPPETMPAPAKPEARPVTIRAKTEPPAGAAQASPARPPAETRGLPPEVMAARRLVEKPVPNTSGPTIFGEDLISEKSLDEVILSYLAGDGEDH